jgi:hypothetical protein
MAVLCSMSCLGQDTAHAVARAVLCCAVGPACGLCCAVQDVLLGAVACAVLWGLSKAGVVACSVACAVACVMYGLCCAVRYGLL